MNCPVCREPVEDEGLCVRCWDLQCENGGSTMRRRRNVPRDREIVAAKAAGEKAVRIARRLGLSRRSVFRVLEHGR